MTGLWKLLVCLALCSVSSAHAASDGRVIPTAFEAGHFYATPRTSKGQTVRLLVDTGGGGMGILYIMKASALKRIGGQAIQCRLPGFSFDGARMPLFTAATRLPAPAGPEACGAAAAVVNTLPDLGYDGVLGAAYLSHFIWTFDYPAQRLIVESPSWQPDAHATHAPLLFARNSAGEWLSDFPAITLTVDGEALSLLLDTGATALPTPSGAAAQHIATVNGIGVTSYIITSIFNRWHARHPDWPVVLNGDRLIPGTRLIRVPDVTIGAVHVGPVWFSERPDVNFGPERMSLWMGQTVVGAAGANVYGRFRVTVDYPHETLWMASPAP